MVLLPKMRIQAFQFSFWCSLRIHCTHIFKKCFHKYSHLELPLLWFSWQPARRPPHAPAQGGGDDGDWGTSHSAIWTLRVSPESHAGGSWKRVLFPACSPALWESPTGLHGVRVKIRKRHSIISKLPLKTLFTVLLYSLWPSPYIFCNLEPDSCYLNIKYWAIT